jgi:PEGA domain
MYHRPVRIPGLLVLLATTTALADAGPKRAVVLAPVWKGDISDVEKITLGASLAASVAAQGYTVVEERLRDATLEGDARLAGCIGTAECKLQLAERLDAQLAVSSTVTRTLAGKRDDKGEWLISIAILPLDVRRLGATDLRRCPSCTVAQLEPIVTSLTGAVFARERKRGRATLVVRSEPTGAQVTLDGANLGATELKQTVYAESHVLEVDAGGRRARARFDAGAGNTHLFRADLATGRMAEEGGGSGGMLRPLGVVGLVAGVAAAGAGIGLLALHGKGTCSPVPPAEQCPQRYNTLGGGLGLTIGGAALALVGAILVVVGGRSAPAVALAPVPLEGGGGLAAAGGF